MRQHYTITHPATPVRVHTAFLTSWCSLVLVGLLMPAVGQAAGRISFDETRWVSVGAGLRAGLSVVEDSMASSDDYDTDFALNNARLYLNGQMFKGILGTLITEFFFAEDEADVRLYNGIIRFEFTEVFNVWLGRFTAPSDRPNMEGPFFILNLDFPFVSAFPSEIAGQSDGLAIWGELFKRHFKYQLGAFNGVDTPADHDDEIRWTARLVYNFLDPEPGYYSAGTYYGTKKILAVGFAVQHQEEAAGTATNPDDFTGFSVDLLFEYPLAIGVITLEGAFYNYDFGNNPLANQVDGEAFYVQGGVLFPHKIGIGQFQPVFRLQRFEVSAPATAADTTHYDFGLNYIIQGFDARVMFEYTRIKVSPGKDRNAIQFLVQIQF